MTSNQDVISDAKKVQALSVEALAFLRDGGEPPDGMTLEEAISELKHNIEDMKNLISLMGREIDA